jgi:DMSO/TMAO reductase YedYZ molybdopterin-dependent catalytic subunit
VRGEPIVAPGEERSGNARHDELRRMDRRAPVDAAQGVRPERRGTWFVAEGSEEVKGASSMPIAKAMDDCIVAYGMNGEAVRPQKGFPLRLMVPGFEGIFHTKWLRRIKVVDRYYMNYNDFGHLDRDPKVAALTTRSDRSP